MTTHANFHHHLVFVYERAALNFRFHFERGSLVFYPSSSMLEQSRRKIMFNLDLSDVGPSPTEDSKGAGSLSTSPRDKSVSTRKKRRIPGRKSRSKSSITRKNKHYQVLDDLEGSSDEETSFGSQAHIVQTATTRSTSPRFHQPSASTTAVSSSADLFLERKL